MQFAVHDLPTNGSHFPDLGLGEENVSGGETELALDKLGAFLTARYGTIADAKEKLGEVSAIRKAFIEVQGELYAR